LGCNEDELTERAARVQAVIEALPTERRKIFRLSRNEGLKYQEIAEKLGPLSEDGGKPDGKGAKDVARGTCGPDAAGAVGLDVAGMDTRRMGVKGTGIVIPRRS
jgi:hypothetical protein